MEKDRGYVIVGEWCVGCGKCLRACPKQCIRPGAVYAIRQEECLRCGRCADACPTGAVKRRRLS